jgi:Glycosyl transferase family 2
LIKECTPAKGSREARWHKVTTVLTSFSIIIPTRNRCDLLAKALSSAAAQQEDVQIIVSDNSTIAAHCVGGQALAAHYEADARIRFIRPIQPLAMPAHWEFATRHATGTYLIVLTDRFTLRPGALATLTRLIATAPSGPPDILRWGTDCGMRPDGIWLENPHSGLVSECDSRRVLAEFAKGAQWRSRLLGSNSLPRGLNSAVRRSLLDSVREENGEVYVPLAPDYTSAFQILARAQKMVEIDLPLIAAHGTQSNGASVMRDGVAGYTDQFALDPFERCPLAIDTVINTTFRDYLWVDAQVGGRLPPIDPVGYLLINYRELQIKRELGSKLPVAAMRREILKAAAKLSSTEQAEFARGKEEIDTLETPLYRLRNLLARTGGLSLAKRLARAFMSDRSASGPHYPDILTAIAAQPYQEPQWVSVSDSA